MNNFMAPTLQILKCYSKVLFLSTSVALCSFEYELLKKQIDCYTRPITFLGITRNHALFFELAMQYPDSVFVLWDCNMISNAIELPENIIHLRSLCTTALLKRIGESEHFDMVYIQEPHQCTSQEVALWYHVGEHVIVQSSFKKEIIPYFYTAGFTDLVTHGQEVIASAYHPITFLRRNQWLEEPNEGNYVRNITSTYHEKLLHKTYGPNPVKSQWMPGINLVTFKMLQGAIPSATQLCQEIDRLFYIPHLDWMPNNIIVQGNQLQLIDFDVPGSPAKTVHTPHMLYLQKLFVAEEDPDNIPALFETILVYCREQLHPVKSMIHAMVKCMITKARYFIDSL
jgi:hypothetical protein